MMDCFVYMLSNKKNGTLNTGVTNNLERRMYEHKNGTFDGFSKKYNLKKLVYYEQFNDINETTLREKRLKKWNRDWKIKLIVSNNPEWKDLSEDFF